MLEGVKLNLRVRAFCVYNQRVLFVKLKLNFRKFKICSGMVFKEIFIASVQ